MRAPALRHERLALRSTMQRMLSLPSRALCFAALCSTFGPARSARPQAAPAPQRTLVRQVRLGLAADAPVRTLVLEGGRIQSVLEPGAAEPPGARIVEGAEQIALPAFIDACAPSWVETPQPASERDLPVPLDSGPRIDMRAANRKGVQPSYRAISALAVPADKAKAWREAGFGAVCASPSGQILAGTSALVTARTAAVRDLVVDADVWMQAAFDASGPGYPSTLMGYQAQLRQLFLDAQRHAELTARWKAGRPGARPAFDVELEAALPLLHGGMRLACAAERALEIERWIALADEFDLKIAIVGGREAWRVREELARRSIPVVLTLDWGEEVKDPHEDDAKKKAASEEQAQAGGEEGAAQAPAEAEPKKVEPQRDYEEPLPVREERRRLWEEGRDCALRLAEAGVPFAFGSGKENAAGLAKKVRTLVEEGLTPDSALAALTSQAAAILGAERELGALESGRDATLCLWTKSPFEKGAKLAWVFVDGFPHELDVAEQEADETPPDKGVDASGTWDLTFEGEGDTRTGQAVLEMEKEGPVSGTLTTEDPSGGKMETEVEGRVSRKQLKLRGTFQAGEVQIEFELTAELSGDELEGESVGKAPMGEFKSKVKGTRKPQRRNGGER
jgi:Amidohydrolase family